MQRAGNILKKFLKDFGLDSSITLNAIENQWLEIVGQTIAEHTFPDIIKGSTIFVTVDTPQWMHHLNFYKQDICDKLKPFSVSEIRFKLGALPEKPEIKQSISNVPLTEEDYRYIENTVRSIKDDELKEKFRALLVKALKNKKK